VEPPPDPGMPSALAATDQEVTAQAAGKLASRWRDTLPLSAVLLAAFALRVWLLGDQNIWWDEGLAIWAVRQGWARMTLWTAGDVHPPLYFWLLKAWVSLAGESEFAARFISLLCGVLTVAALYSLAKSLLGRRIALLATLLLSFSRFHVWWSQEMRMYIVATLWGVLSLHMLLRWCRAEGWYSVPRSVRGWYSVPRYGRDRRGGGPAGTQARPQRPAWQALLYVLTTAAGLYTLYLFVTVVLIQNLFFLYLLLCQHPPLRRHSLPRWVLAQVAILALFVPWLALALPRMQSWSVAEPFSLRIFVQLYATLLTLGISTYVENYTLLVVPFLAIVGAAMLLLSRAQRLRQVQTQADQPAAGTARATHEGFSIALLLGLFLIVPTFVVYVLTRPRGLFYAPRVEARYLVLFAPAFYLLLAWSLALLYRRAKCLGLAALLFVAVAFAWTLPGQYTGRYLRDEHQTMVRIIAAYAQPGDAVLLVAGSRYPIFGYYYERLPNASTLPPVYAIPQHSLQISQDNVERELAPLAATHGRLWLAQVNAPMEDPQGLVQSWLDQRYARTLDFGFAYNALTLYAAPGEAARIEPGNLTPQYSLSGALGAGTSVLGYDLPTHEFRPGDVVRLALYYAASHEAQADVHLVDGMGRILEQRQVALPQAETMGREQFEFAVYSHTPGGAYHFELLDPALPSQVISFGSLRVARTEPVPQAGVPPIGVSAHLEDGIDLLGYRLLDAQGRPVTTIRPGQRLNLDLYWVARQKSAQNYTVFAHLVGMAYNPATEGPVWAGNDSEPLERGYPTEQWFVNQVVVDRHALTVEPGAPAGEYELEVGMYLLQTMKRLQVMDDQGQTADRVVLGRFAVVEP
jgi:mannosyltransferase